MSGGADSLISLFWAKERFEHVKAVSFNYGQKHITELEQAEAICAQVNVPHTLIKLSGYEKIGNSALLDDTISVKIDKKTGKPTTWVPGRNAIFLMYATALAHVNGITDLVTGVTVSDFIRYPELTIEWIAGFFDAEGCLSQSRNSGGNKTYYPTISISQKDKQILEKIRDFFGEGYVTKHGTCYTWQVNHRGNVLKVVPQLIPYLHHSEKRQKYDELAEKFNLPKYNLQHPMTNDWIIGFWEGDGGISKITLTQGKYDKTYEYPMLQFYQKNKELLEKIVIYLGVGSVSEPKPNMHCLSVYPGKTATHPIYQLLYDQIRTKYRRQQINTVYLTIGSPMSNINPHYPDCTPEFIKSLEQTLQYATDNPNICIHTPLMWLTKAESIKLAKKNRALEYLHMTQTCYEGKSPACGVCPSCKLRIAGFKEAGIIDPIKYEIDIDWENCKEVN